MADKNNPFDPNDPDSFNQYIREVTLPSGKKIEVISFDDGPQGPTENEVHICPDCASDLVYPIAWEEAGRTSWEVSLRCPNCEWTITAVFKEDAIQRFDKVLDRGTEALVTDLRQLTRANMEEDVERFVLAIDGGHVLPEDF